MKKRLGSLVFGLAVAISMTIPSFAQQTTGQGQTKEQKKEEKKEEKAKKKEEKAQKKAEKNSKKKRPNGSA